uniref:HAT C-terminal dimerisation domain-containing protein n=1 Tax=Zea mays TaxID=4577 RepID=B6TH87_MAIZE|nr:hypothetical protein [Zea mays]
MSIQVSTVASESAFSAAGRVVDPYRNRLDSEMVQALICTKDWIRASRKDSTIIHSILADLKPSEAIPISQPCMDDEEQDVESDPDVMNDYDEL